MSNDKTNSNESQNIDSQIKPKPNNITKPQENIHIEQKPQIIEIFVPKQPPLRTDSYNPPLSTKIKNEER